MLHILVFEVIEAFVERNLVPAKQCELHAGLFLVQLSWYCKNLGANVHGSWDFSAFRGIDDIKLDFIFVCMNCWFDLLHPNAFN